MAADYLGADSARVIPMPTETLLDREWERRGQAIRAFNALPDEARARGPRMSSEELRLWAIISDAENAIHTPATGNLATAEVRVWLALWFECISENTDELILDRDLASLLARGDELSSDARLLLAAINDIRAVRAAEAVQ